MEEFPCELFFRRLIGKSFKPTITNMARYLHDHVIASSPTLRINPFDLRIQACRDDLQQRNSAILLDESGRPSVSCSFPILKFRTSSMKDHSCLVRTLKQKQFSKWKCRWPIFDIVFIASLKWHVQGHWHTLGTDNNSAHVYDVHQRLFARYGGKLHRLILQCIMDNCCQHNYSHKKNI